MMNARGEELKPYYLYNLSKSKEFMGNSLFPAHGIMNYTDSRFLFYNIVMSRGEFG